MEHVAYDEDAITSNDALLKLDRYYTTVSTKCTIPDKSTTVMVLTALIIQNLGSGGNVFGSKRGTEKREPKLCT